MGGGKPGQVKACLRIISKTGIAVSLILSAPLMLFGRKILILFSADAQMVEAGLPTLFTKAIVAGLQILYSVCGDGLQAAGDTRYTARVSFISTTPILRYQALCFAASPPESLRAPGARF